MAEPITVGGGGGLTTAQLLTDYDIDLEFNESAGAFVNDGHDNFVYAGHKLASLQVQDYAGTVIADLTKLLPGDAECEVILKFNHGSERIYIRSKPLRVSFDPDLWTPAGGGKRRRRTKHDRLVADFGRGKWQRLEISTPTSAFKIVAMSD